MSPSHRSRRSLAAGIAAAATFAVAACGSSSKSTTATTAAATTGTAATAATAQPGDFAKAHYTTDLSKDCPATITIQKDWLAEAEHAALYQLIGGGGTMGQNIYSGPLGATGVTLEVLDGGPGLGDGVSTASSLFAGNLVQKKTPMLAYVGTDDAAQFSKKFPVTAVVSPLDKSPTMLMYDPATYKSLTTLKDVIATGADVYVTSKSLTYVQFLINQGLPASKIIEGYAGDKEKFITSGGKLINQGYVSNEVYSYEHETPTWNKPTAHILVNSLGYQPYPSALSVRTDKLTELTPCLKKLVPLIQQAQVDYMKDPAEVNTLLSKYNPDHSAAFWFTSKALSDAAVDVMRKEAIVVDGPQGMGSFDMDRMKKQLDILMPIFKKEGIDTFVTGLTADKIVTNQFIDSTIKLGT